MAKKKINISEALKKGKTNIISEEAIEKATQQIQKGTTAKSEEKERTKRLSVDTPVSLYVALKKKVAEEDTTIRDFVIEQIRKGIEG